ncbi:hypothetical protein B296_00031600 [Ensete ventricosum]|uniref:Uncharacterized protein n=1 Tax=Ensete ventricosum TaxID=4639 RepID=A0A426YBX9_ENSVE|nr:hypothetical protein B296_00031600 [Ensete ventricosum]
MPVTLPLLPPTTANRSCCLSPSPLILLLPPPSTSSSSSASHVVVGCRRYHWQPCNHRPPLSLSYISRTLSPMPLLLHDAGRIPDATAFLYHSQLLTADVPSLSLPLPLLPPPSPSAFLYLTPPSPPLLFPFSPAPSSSTARISPIATFQPHFHQQHLFFLAERSLLNDRSSRLLPPTSVCSNNSCCPHLRPFFPTLTIIVVPVQLQHGPPLHL